jgi:phosphodiesterase/alkaline phosphatase D-like protein
MTVDAALTRRALLIAGGATVATVAAGASAAAGASPLFVHGVASGDPLPDGIQLWTRVTPTPQATPGSGAGPVTTVTWQVATDPGFATVVRSGEVATGPERDHTVKVDVRGLSPATTYWYRFSVGNQVSAVGWTGTTSRSAPTRAPPRRR